MTRLGHFAIGAALAALIWVIVGRTTGAALLGVGVSIILWIILYAGERRAPSLVVFLFSAALTAMLGSALTMLISGPAFVVAEIFAGLTGASLQARWNRGQADTASS